MQHKNTRQASAFFTKQAISIQRGCCHRCLAGMAGNLIAQVKTFPIFFFLHTTLPSLLNDACNCKPLVKLENDSLAWPSAWSRNPPVLRGEGCLHRQGVPNRGSQVTATETAWISKSPAKCTRNASSNAPTWLPFESNPFSF